MCFCFVFNWFLSFGNSVLNALKLKATNTPEYKTSKKISRYFYKVCLKIIGILQIYFAAADKLFFSTQCRISKKLCQITIQTTNDPLLKIVSCCAWNKMRFVDICISKLKIINIVQSIDFSMQTL